MTLFLKTIAFGVVATSIAACAKDPVQEGADSASWAGPLEGEHNALLSNSPAVCSSSNGSLAVENSFTVPVDGSRAGMFQDFVSLSNALRRGSAERAIRVTHNNKSYNIILATLQTSQNGIQVVNFGRSDAQTSPEDVRNAFYVTIVAKQGRDIPVLERNYATLNGVFIDRINIQAKQGGQRAELVCTRPFLAATQAVAGSVAGQREFNRECSTNSDTFRPASADFSFTVRNASFAQIVSGNSSARVKWSLYSYVRNSEQLVQTGEVPFNRQSSVNFSIPLETVGAKRVKLEVFGAASTPFATKSQTFTVTKRDGSCALGFGEDAMRNQLFSLDDSSSSAR